MDGSFDTMALPYLASPMSLNTLQNAEFMNSLPVMDLPDHTSNFDTETFVRWVLACGALWGMFALTTQ